MSYLYDFRGDNLPGSCAPFSPSQLTREIETYPGVGLSRASQQEQRIPDPLSSLETSALSPRSFRLHSSPLRSRDSSVRQAFPQVLLSSGRIFKHHVVLGRRLTRSRPFYTLACLLLARRISTSSAGVRRQHAVLRVRNDCRNP